MISIEKRIRKVEAVIGQDSKENGARGVVSFMQEIGAIDEHADTERMVSEFARSGLSMRSLLGEIDGLTLGPPGLRHEEPQRQGFR